MGRSIGQVRHREDKEACLNYRTLRRSEKTSTPISASRQESF